MLCMRAHIIFYNKVGIASILHMRAASYMSNNNKKKNVWYVVYVYSRQSLTTQRYNISARFFLTKHKILIHSQRPSVEIELSVCIVVPSALCCSSRLFFFFLPFLLTTTKYISYLSVYNCK